MMAREVLGPRVGSAAARQYCVELSPVSIAADASLDGHGLLTSCESSYLSSQRSNEEKAYCKWKETDVVFAVGELEQTDASAPFLAQGKSNNLLPRGV
jgi:hypothetical protein